MNRIIKSTVESLGTSKPKQSSIEIQVSLLIVACRVHACRTWALE